MKNRKKEENAGIITTCIGCILMGIGSAILSKVNQDKMDEKLDKELDSHINERIEEHKKEETKKKK